MPKKGVSAEEKKLRMVSMFTESGEVWTMKDVEKGAGNKGIIAQAVKDVLKEVCGDDLVHEEKVGISTYYWAFPGETGVKKRRDRDHVSSEVERLNKQVKLLEEDERKAKEAAEAAAGESAAVSKFEASVASLRARRDEVRAETQRLESASSQDLRARRKDIPVLRDSANRWTDNLFEIRKQLTEKFGMEGKSVDQQFGTSGLDYVD
jgi:outer membrane murein-binding lipoprotein Lpp